jgi:hypothetical protein
MNSHRALLDNLSKLHTTKLGIERIKRNLNLADIDVVDFCRQLIVADDCTIQKRGKNWYCSKDDTVVTVNSYSLTVITAHKEK